MCAALNRVAIPGDLLAIHTERWHTLSDDSVVLSRHRPICRPSIFADEVALWYFVQTHRHHRHGLPTV